MNLEDFRTLVRDQELSGFVDWRAENELAIMLKCDYETGRANAFEYFDMLRGHTAREAFELRKSAVLPVPGIMSATADLASIIDLRTERLSKMFMDYHDENWQYWWVQHLLLSREQQEDFEFLFERFVVDGDIAKDQFENPATKFAREFIWGK